MTDKLKHLEEIKEYLSPNEYKFSMASIAATEYVKLMYWKGKRVTRQQITNRVYTLLKSNCIEPVSYEFIRKIF